MKIAEDALRAYYRNLRETEVTEWYTGDAFDLEIAAGYSHDGGVAVQLLQRLAVASDADSFFESCSRYELIVLKEALRVAQPHAVSPEEGSVWVPVTEAAINGKPFSVQVQDAHNPALCEEVDLTGMSAEDALVKMLEVARRTSVE